MRFVMENFLHIVRIVSRYSTLRLDALRFLFEIRYSVFYRVIFLAPAPPAARDNAIYRTVNVTCA